MSTFIIEGGHQLKGDIQPQGAKNEALQVICATLLTDEKIRIKNVPEIRDVLHLIETLKVLGVNVTHVEKGVFDFESGNVNPDRLRSDDYN